MMSRFMETIQVGMVEQVHRAAAVVPANTPWDGIKPNWEVLGPAFDNVWVRFAGAVLAIALAITGAMFLRGIVSYSQHRTGSHPAQAAEAKQEMVNGGAGFAAVLAFSVIIGAIVLVVTGGDGGGGEASSAPVSWSQHAGR